MARILFLNETWDQMLLLVDAGNTRIKWALTELLPSSDHTPLGQWVASGSSIHQELTQMASTWKSLGISKILISNVAGPTVRAALLDAISWMSGEVNWFVSTAECGGIRNNYRNPSQLGSDRFASAIAAHALFPQQMLIVVTCGTATTIDAISPDSHFLGGMILPGLGLMATTLARNTAQLPQVGEQLANIQPFADNTEDAIVSGCLAAQAGAIEHAVALLLKQHQNNVRCLLSGGAASFITPHLSVPHERVESLVLIGLQIVGREKSLC